MKNRLLILLSTLAIVGISMLPQQAKATHASGAEIVYEWLGDSTYRFFFKFYRDCTLNPNGTPATAAPPNTVNLCFFNNCTNTAYNRVMTRWTGTIPPGVANGTQVSRGCSMTRTDCENPNSSVPGYEEWWYSVIEPLPLACNSWKFAAWINARNTSNNIGGGQLYVETTFNSANTWANNSPYFSIKPIPYVCINTPYTFNNGSIDADGDSLVSEVIRPLNAPTGNSCTNPAQLMGLRAQPTGFPAITFPGNPIQSNGSFSLNPSTGQINFTASLIGAETMTIRTREYRNGQLLGSIMRDIQVQVLQCNPTIPKIDTPSIDIKGGQWLNNQANGCIDQKMEFCFDVTSADTDAIIILEDNLKQSLPTASISYKNQRTDTVTACFSWTPTVADVGLNNIIITIKDSTCKPPGILLSYTISIPIYIWPSTKAVPDTSICENDAAFLGATGGGNYTWTILSGGTPNSLNNPNIANPIARPTTTTTYVVTSGASSFCTNNTDTVKVDVLSGPKFDGQDDVITCPGKPTALDVKPDNTTGVTYTYNWTPTTYLSSTTKADPTSTTPVDITYYVEIGSNVNSCKGRDTIMIDVLDGFNIENPDTIICAGQSVQIRANGDTRYKYTWTDDAASGVVSNRDIIAPSLTPAPHGEYTYTVKASYAGCDDSIATLKVEVQPIPSVVVNPDKSICFDDTTSLSADVTPANYTNYSYKWTPGASLNNDAITNPIFKGTGTTTLILTASTSIGCEGKDTVTVNVFPADFINVSNDTAICPGDTAIIAMTVPTGTQYYWSPDISINSTEDMSPKVWPVANQLYTVYARDINNCKDTARVKIKVQPKAILHLPDSIRLYPKETYHMNPEGNCVYYSWFPTVGLSNPSIGNPRATPDVNTRYIVRASTEGGCMATDSIDVLVIEDSYVKLPNAFTPGNGNNATFKIVGRGAIELKSFAIYNRWGTKVFETKDANQGWDGRFNGEPQPMGVYIYSIEATTPTGRTINKQGNVTLIR
ncbi:MAG: gliding motility-associated C-terminal domain-containing protein [Flavipsychrobacter sp.]